MADLKALSIRFMEAVRDRDLDWLDEHLGNEFTLTTGRAGAPVRNRDEWLEITRHRYVIEEFAFEELEVHEYGDVGVVRSRYRQRGSMDGDDRTQTFLMTDVWVERAERPELVTRHVSPLPRGAETELA
jgi:ketosteroid isomerase-like protein